MALTVGGCEDFLEHEPYGVPTADNFWKTEDDVKNALDAFYDYTNYEGVCGRGIFYYENCSDDMFNRPGCDSIDAEFIDNIGFLASMHDVGKIGTPDDILNKEGPLSDWEWTVMKEHTKNGAFILSTYPNPMAKEIALSHHEKWNGNGYPYQIEGDMIPLSARIVAIADVYDALRMKRSYKEEMTHETAVEKIMESKGSHFDPAITEIFFGIANKFNEIYEANKD